MMGNPFSLNLDGHLASDEKLLLFFRPSRLGYLHHYVFLVILFLFASLLLGFGYAGSGGGYALYALERVIGYALLLLAVILLVRIEYRIWSRKYAVTTQRVLYSRGIFSETFQSASFDYITDIEMQQTFWDKIVDCGSLFVNTAGASEFEFRYREVRHPLEIKKRVNDLQDQARATHGPPIPTPKLAHARRLSSHK
jgi:uncharacterized membrane protein YdbT with pleckstrin-like domain